MSSAKKRREIDRVQSELAKVRGQLSEVHWFNALTAMRPAYASVILDAERWRAFRKAAAGHDEGFMDRWQNACGNLADLTEADIDRAIDEARNANPT